MMRNYIRKFVANRRSGQRNSKLKDQSDILTLLLEAPDIFDDEAIIDQILSLFFEGSLTIQSAT